MKKHIYLVLAMVVILLSPSCYDDKGNYDYAAENKVIVEEFEKEYNVISFKEYFQLKPTITKTIESDELEYIWTLHPNVREDLESAESFWIDTISTERDLNYEVTLKPGRYTVNFKLTNKSNGNTGLNMTTTLVVVTEFSEGYYILKEIGGNTELDFFNKKNEYFPDLLTQSVGTPLEGKPLSLGFYPTLSYIDETTGGYLDSPFLFPLTETSNLAMMRVEDMVKIRDFEDMFYASAPVDEKPIAFYPGVFYAAGYISNKGIYSSYQFPDWGMMGSGQFAEQGKFIDSKGYELHYYSILNEWGTLNFDIKNGRYLITDYNADAHLIDDTDAKFPTNGIEHKLLYMGESIAGSTEIHSIFEKKDGSGRLLYIMKDPNIQSMKATITDVQEINPALKFAKATKFANNRSGANMIYFISENKMYTLTVGNNTAEQTEAPMNIEGLPAYDEITYFDTMFFKVGANEDKYFNRFIIGTVKDGKYTLSMYDMVGGLTYGAPKVVLTGDGKPTAIQYVNPDKHSATRTGISIHY